eukprot:TRINITY_DN8150_c0_g1_i2.p1 TRINITY_DN8150_c0_g1~~TRINITY_DN8150_c0_g1_i2.p1  ORF type:complete len:183 (-),score=19.49 TRINITY_DN8150_c0_g1_i2:72-620(-)
MQAPVVSQTDNGAGEYTAHTNKPAKRPRLPGPPPRQPAPVVLGDGSSLAQNQAVIVTYHGRLYDAIVLQIDRAKHRKGKHIRVEFEQDRTSAWVRQTAALPAPASQLPGFQPGDRIRAQDVMAAPNSEWHMAVFKHAVRSADGRSVRSWVEFESSGLGQWCYPVHIQLASGVRHTWVSLPNK